MRPPSVYAKRSCPAGDPCDLLALLHGPHRIGCRLVMILLSHHGWSAATIAELLGCDPRTVRRWVQRYNIHGAHSLADRPRPGRPGSGAHGWAIVSAAPGPAAGLDHPAAAPVPGPTRHQPAHPAPPSPRGGGLAATAAGRQGRPRPRPGLGRAAPGIATLPKGAVVLAEDETHLNLLSWVRATWIVRGTRQRVMTPGKNRRRTIFGAVDLHSGRFLYQVCRKAVSASFTAFCEQLLAAYPTAPVVAVVCDNVIIHHSKIVQAWLASHPRVRVLHGARYSPHDNPVERIWGALKAYLANSPTPTMAGRIRQSMPSSALAARPATGHRRPRQLTWLPNRYGQNSRKAA